MAEGKTQFCESCLKTGESVSACAFCYDCSEHVCQGCVVQHKKFKQMSGHKLVNLVGGERDKNVNTETVKLLREISKCQKHPENELEYICKDHEQVCCTVCGLEFHRKCDHLVSISDEIVDKNKIQCKTVGELDVLQEQLLCIMEVEKKNEDEVEQSKEIVTQTLAEIKQEMDAAYVSLEQKVLASVDKTSTCILQGSQTNSSDAKQINDRMMSLITAANMIKEHENPILCYLFDHYHRQQVSKVRSDVSNLTEKTRNKKMTMRNMCVKSYCQSIAASLNLEVVESKPIFDFNPALASDVIEDTVDVAQKSATSIYDVDVNTVLGTYIIYPTLCVWFRNYIMLFYTGSLRGQLFDVSMKKVVCPFHLGGGAVLSAVNIDDNIVAVCDGSDSIKMLSVQENKVKVIQTLTTNPIIYKIKRMTFNKVYNILVCLSVNAVIFLKLDGKCVNYIMLSADQEKLVKDARSIGYDTQNRRIFISSNDYVFSFDNNGQHFATLPMKSPWGINADSENNLYVVYQCCDSFCQLLPGGKLGRKIKITPKPSLAPPTCITFNSDSSMFALLCKRGLLKLFSYG